MPTIAILATTPQKAELHRSPVFKSHQLIFAQDLHGLLNLQADAYMDLVLEPGPERIEALSHLLPSPIFINSVIQTLSVCGADFIRINGWPGFLEMPLLEAASGEISGSRARDIFGNYIIFVKDVPGLVNPRIISMIINEAYYTLAAGTATRGEIDIAMKLGTGYPMGPFEWGEKIGLLNIYALLTTMGKTNPLYDIAPGI
ncbi:MAG: 3-hydroxyacyl-CoA dehydrogenase family protein [Puia sp.]